MGKATFTTLDYTLELEASGIKPHLTNRSSLALGLYALVFCEGLTPGKMGKAACPMFSATGAAVGYWAPEIVLPSWIRMRDVYGVGDVRGDGDTTSRLMSFGVGSTPRYEGGKSLWHRMLLLMQLLAAAEQSNIPGPVMTVLLGRAGWDWEYDVQCVAESLQTESCYLGTRLSTTCRTGALRCKATSMVQVPVRLDPNVIRDFLSDDFDTRRKAFVQIAMGHGMDQPLLATLKASQVSLGLAEGPIAPLLPEGGSYFQRFESGLDFPVGLPQGWGARLSTTPTLQIGKMIRASGRQLLTLRVLGTISGGWGAFATKGQRGPQLLVDIGAEGQTADSQAVREFAEGLTGMFDSGELPASSRQPVARALEAALDDGSIALDPAARTSIDDTLKRLAASPE